MSDELQRRAGEIRTVYIQHLLHCGVATGFLNRQESLFKTVCTLLKSNTARLHADGGAGQAAFYSQRWRDGRDGARYIRAGRAEARGGVVQEPFWKKKRGFGVAAEISERMQSQTLEAICSRQLFETRQIIRNEARR